ncbi:twin-arginine translocase TatA/TatE family subunit [Microbacterium hydrocarbonoxydans]|uniref:twin-arginine translocase TatA/TatE family subunit n=1 Tax=Microbacterium hydrocarbonoxydans TaxID=273678 RepID=UPI003D95DF3B
MLQNLTGWYALIILAIIVLIFGAAKLPALARSVGQSVRILRAEAAEHVETVPASASPRSEQTDAPAPVRPETPDAPRPVLNVAE